jgi:orotate phosphoribosyltransferase
MPVDVAKLLESSGAILTGHFQLSSGRRSHTYFEKFRILERPDVLSALCADIADHFRDAGVQVVAGPTTGGIIIAFEVGRQMGLPTRYVESENGVKKLRRNAQLEPGTRVLLVDDVLTTGLSLRETADALRGYGAEIVGIAALIDRSVDFDAGAPFFATYRVESESYAPDDVPEWLAAIPVTKPGTRAS